MSDPHPTLDQALALVTVGADQLQRGVRAVLAHTFNERSRPHPAQSLAHDQAELLGRLLGRLSKISGLLRSSDQGLIADQIEGLIAVSRQEHEQISRPCEACQGIGITRLFDWCDVCRGSGRTPLLTVGEVPV